MTDHYAAVANSAASVLAKLQIVDQAQGIEFAEERVTLTDTQLLSSTATTVSIHVTDDTKLYFVPAAGVPPYEETSVGRTFGFSLVDGSWVLAAQVLDTSTGPAPSTDTTVVSVPPQTSTKIAASATPDSLGASTPASTSRSGVARVAAAAVFAPSIAPGLNYTTMVNYELTHWNDDGSYRNYSGEDCTNFLSQAMKAGGWTYRGSGSGNTGNHSDWFYGSTKGSTSDTWVSAKLWNTFARGSSNRVAVLTNVWFTQLGDVIQAKWAGKSSITHSMMVTSAPSSGERYMTYHSTNTKNRPLSDIIATNPGATYYADRT